jgi:hypothetical protein
VIMKCGSDNQQKHNSFNALLRIYVYSATSVNRYIKWGLSGGIGSKESVASKRTKTKSDSRGV